MSILVTGSNFVLDWLVIFAEPVINRDALSCTGNLRKLAFDGRCAVVPQG